MLAALELMEFHEKDEEFNYCPRSRIYVTNSIYIPIYVIVLLLLSHNHYML